MSECAFLFAGHLGACLGCLVGLSGQVDEAVDDDAMEFLFVGGTNHLGIAANGVERDENISVDRRFGGVVEGDGVGVVVVLEELPIDFELAFIRAKNVVNFAHLVAVVGRHDANPAADEPRVEHRHFYILRRVMYHAVCAILLFKINLQKPCRKFVRTFFNDLSVANLLCYHGSGNDAQSDNWSYQLGDGSEVGNPGWGNNEKQSYTSNKKNIAVNEDLDDDGEGDGMLRLTASYEEDG